MDSVARFNAWVRSETAIVGFAVFAYAAAFGRFRRTAFENYTYLGDAFVHGHLWIVPPGPFMSAVPWNGHFYVIEPVFPGLLMMPFTLFLGLAANETFVSVLVLAIGAMACWSFLTRIGLARPMRLLLLGVMLFATAYFYSGVAGDVWQMASITAVSATFLLFDEVLGRNRPWLVAIYAGAAALSRYTLLPTLPVYCVFAYLAFGKTYARTFVLALSPFVLFLLGYNYARFGWLTDRGYWLYETELVHVDKPMLGVGYIPMQLDEMFLKPFRYQNSFPWIVPDHFGTGILFSSLVFFGAFAAPWKDRAVKALWMLTAVALIPNLLYYDSGDGQFYFRHFVDFAPFLFALLALAVRARRLPGVTLVAVANVLIGMVEMFVYA